MVQRVERVRVVGLGDAGVGHPIVIGNSDIERIIQIAFWIPQECELETKLPRMFPMHPRQVVGEIVNRTLKRRRARNALAEVQFVPWKYGVSFVASALPHESIAKVIQQG